MSTLHRKSQEMGAAGEPFDDTTDNHDKAELTTATERSDHDRNAASDASTPTLPSTPRRPDLLSRLTLQLPPSAPAVSVPLTPAIPRHSRGMDFSRASTTLHHSTLAESDADSSPIISHKGMPIPARRLSSSAMAVDSLNMGSGGAMPWGSLALGHEKSTVSSSVGSTNLMASESETSSSDDDASMGGDDIEDPVFSTPQVHKLQNSCAPTPFQQSTQAPSTPTASTWGTGSHFSPAQASLLKTIRRTRLHKSSKGRSRKSSSSASGSGYSSVASPRTTSPPPMRSIETAGGGYFAMANAARSRRESLAMGTDSLHLSSGNDSGDEANASATSTPGVVRRPVVRRGNLLPKTKGFARIRAALIEEAAPVDAESRREAETIRQVRERDNSVTDFESHDRPQSSTAASSPNLLPAVPESAQEDFGRDLDGDSGVSRGLGLGTNFSDHATRNSGGLEYWNRFDSSARTPPPATFGRQSSSAVSDTNMDSPFGDFTMWRRPRARSSASDASEAIMSNGAGAVLSDDMHLQKFKKRPREDDFDIGTIKRRAVSPGMSTAQNSPVLTNSPSSRDTHGGGWGQPPERLHKAPSNGSDAGSQAPPTRAGSGGSISGGANMVSQGKKLGLQPMADTRDELMKMSIE
ncbi:hypothetical protein CB0940_01780 [Cercospora beticola]|uniref:Uncharacterized protein n=1 Tax=Cercospora beticola TaxID=122368 RepID=A0A2G5IB18_CERBT|nr:hypothetical protein CB0940_01780 [Cercospora beticola]PIB01989.1 hypothetical protein CB0940_01780 [Cercospora beticola]WPA97231.1 hypothetical protein RHO25_001840 [Cercospora beticola]CAK1354356.1 unnamed protein product [Cercospora beticola]